METLHFHITQMSMVATDDFKLEYDLLDFIGNEEVVMGSSFLDSIDDQIPLESVNDERTSVDDEALTLLDDLLVNSEHLLVDASPETPKDESLTDTELSSPSPCPSVNSCQTPTDSFNVSTGSYQQLSPGAFPTLHKCAARLGSSNALSTTEEENSEETEDEGAVDDDEDELLNEDTKEGEELEMMHKEATYLRAEYDYLMSRAEVIRNSRVNIKAKHRENHKHKKQLDTKILNELVTQQQVYLDNFRAMLAFAPVNDIRMALMTPLETYIHLGRDFDERRRTILSLREQKLDTTLRYIEEKARGINLDEPYHYSDTFERFGKFYNVHFAVNKYEGVKVCQLMKVVFDQLSGTDESLAQAMGCLSIRESYDAIPCNFLHQRIVSNLKWSDEFEEGLPEFETNALAFGRYSGDSAVLATDYIDRDDLHPYQSTNRIRKDVSCGYVRYCHHFICPINFSLKTVLCCSPMLMPMASNLSS